MKRRIEGVEEHLDEDRHDAAELAQSLEQLADVNRLLGGTRAARRAVLEMLPADGPARVIDVGCGAGDVDAALLRWFSRTRPIDITALDLHPQILAYARERTRGAGSIRFVRGDATALPFADGSFDVAVMSLTLHHFEDEAPVRVLREMGRVARAVVINDLERTWQNYAGARLLARTVWAGNRLTRHDGPLSVQRSFTASELSSLARNAGLRDVVVRRRYFYRLVMTARSGRDDPAASDQGA